MATPSYLRSALPLSSDGWVRPAARAARGGGLAGSFLAPQRAIGVADTARFVLDDAREEKLHRFMRREGFAAREVLASAKHRDALLLEEVEQVQRFMSYGFQPSFEVCGLRY